jgi:exopolyphosphatase/pppGpp-phosphohydrolase
MAAGIGPRCVLAESLPIGIVRLHRAYGETESGLLQADSSALFGLTRLCGGPACRRLRDMGATRLVFGSENATTLRDVAIQLGYLEPDSNSLCRLALHALVPEILAMPTDEICALGVDPERANLVGTTAVVADALADLLGEREVRFTTSGVVEGAALAVAASLAGTRPEIGEASLH